MRYFVYILECADRTLYVGYTNNLEAREQEHHDGRGGRYTATRLPVRLSYSEAFETCAAAQRRERQIKGWTHAKKAALVAGDRDLLRASARHPDARPSPLLFFQYTSRKRSSTFRP